MRRRRWISRCVVGVLILSTPPAFAQGRGSGSLKAALTILKENSRKLESLEPEFRTIRKNHEQMLEDIEYLRIRNRKKGNTRVGGARLERLQKIDLIAQNDSKALEGVDKEINWEIWVDGIHLRPIPQ